MRLDDAQTRLCRSVALDLTSIKELASEAQRDLGVGHVPEAKIRLKRIEGVAQYALEVLNGVLEDVD